MKFSDLEPKPLAIFMDWMLHGLLRMIGKEKEPFTNERIFTEMPSSTNEDIHTS